MAHGSPLPRSSRVPSPRPRRGSIDFKKSVVALDSDATETCAAATETCAAAFYRPEVRFTTALRIHVRWRLVPPLGHRTSSDGKPPQMGSLSATEGPSFSASVSRQSSPRRSVKRAVTRLGSTSLTTDQIAQKTTLIGAMYAQCSAYGKCLVSGGNSSLRRAGSWFRRPEPVRSTTIVMAPRPGGAKSSPAAGGCPAAAACSPAHADVARSPCQAISLSHVSGSMAPTLWRPGLLHGGSLEGEGRRALGVLVARLHPFQTGPLAQLGFSRNLPAFRPKKLSNFQLRSSDAGSTRVRHADVSASRIGRF